MKDFNTDQAPRQGCPSWPIPKKITRHSVLEVLQGWWSNPIEIQRLIPAEDYWIVEYRVKTFTGWVDRVWIFQRP